MPTLTKKRIASTQSTTGNTTLLTTVLICDLAAVQVLSIAPATSPAAYTVVAENTINKIIAVANMNHCFLLSLVNFLVNDFTSIHL